MDQKTYFETRRKHFRKEAKKVLTGEDVLFLRALAQEEERVKNIPVQENTHTIQDIINRKRKERKQPLLEKPKKFLKKKVKKEDLVFAEVKYETPKKEIPEQKENTNTIQEIKKRHIKYVNNFTPKMRVVKHADVSHWFQKKKGTYKPTKN
jgi:predicted RNA-binding protein Jag